MNADTSTLNELIEVLTDGKKFYQEAAHEVTRADLKQFFSRMADTKAAIIVDLQGKVSAEGERPAQRGTLAGTLRKGYAELRAKMADDKEMEYIVQLEQFEDRILNRFRHAVKESDDPSVRMVADKYLPQVIRNHNEMRDLKRGMTKH
ncbi:MAG: PA2169 family four-helix-bundle protein [Dokdonella sp.]